MSLRSFHEPIRAAVIGASGGIGSAFTESLAADTAVAAVLATSRRGAVPESERVSAIHLDLDDEASIETAAATAKRQLGSLDLVIIATGILRGAGIVPEKSFRQLDSVAMARILAVNTIGPALVARHFLPLLPRTGRAVVAALSARIGSIGDNALGGWHSYRASKAALNMLIKSFAIEQARRNADAIIVGLHPGTVTTDLSAPFLRGAADSRLFTPHEAARRLLATLDGLVPADSGGVFAYDGERLPD